MRNTQINVAFTNPQRAETILNRISRGLQTEQDLEILSERIKPTGDPSIPYDAIYIFFLKIQM